MPERRGSFIVFEGIDASGKSRQAELLYKYLKNKNIPVILTREPTEGRVGELLRNALKGEIQFDPRTLALLFAADRIEHIKNKIEPELEKGTIVISDRYYYSSLAYQGLANLDIRWLKSINEYAMKPESKPDLVFYIDITPEESIKRLEASGDLRPHIKKREIFETKELQKEIRSIYLSFPHLEKVNGIYTPPVVLKKQEKQETALRYKYLSLVEEEDMILVDGMKSIEEVHKDVISLVEKKLSHKLNQKKLSQYTIGTSTNLDKF